MAEIIALMLVKPESDSLIDYVEFEDFMKRVEDAGHSVLMWFGLPLVVAVVAALVWGWL